MNTFFSSIQLQQFDGKPTPEIEQLPLVQNPAGRKVMIDPLCAFLHGDVRVVDRIQDSVEANLGCMELNEVGSEVARGSLEDVVLEVEGDVLLHRHACCELAL